MNIWQKHIAYLKDNPEGYWFKRKLYGWGWTPATKAGWMTTFLFALIIIAVSVVHEYRPELIANDDLVVIILAVLILFLTLVYKKGEPPRWQ